MSRISSNFTLRARIVASFFLLFGGLLVGRLFFIQIAGHDFYSAQAERQFVFYQSKPSISIRGDIYFKEKNGNFISAGTLKEGFLAAINPAFITDAEAACEDIAVVATIGKEDCLERSKKENDPYEVIAHRLVSEQAESITKLNLKGVGVYPEQWRFYPCGSLAAQVLGFVGYKGDELVGRYGLEQYYEDVLKGKSENLKEGGSFAALFMKLGKDLLSTDIPNGHDVILTIEPQVQTMLERKLDQLIEQWKAESAGGIILDPQTGAIIAMAGKPSFNPNYYSEVEDISFFRNPLISDLFEMGSVVKALTLAAAVDDDKINENTVYFDQGYVVLNNHRIENYDGKGRGSVSMQTALNKSLNTGAVFAAQQLGYNKFKEYFKNYGLAEKTGIDLPAEVAGDLKNLSFPRDLEYGTASFGQGIAVSPIEFAAAVSSLANGGNIMVPFVVEKIKVNGGKDEVTTPTIKRRVLKKSTSQILTKMLVNVADEALLGGTVKMEHYSFAAKTGTAQLPKEEGGGYYEDRYLHSFFGYAPAFDAKFLIFLYLKKPQEVRYASHTLTQPFVDLMTFLLNYYQVPPDR